jgi:hypothetical protein
VSFPYDETIRQESAVNTGRRTLTIHRYNHRATAAELEAGCPDGVSAEDWKAFASRIGIGKLYLRSRSKVRDINLKIPLRVAATLTILRTRWPIAEIKWKSTVV